ncbi:MAG TPA: hypothetical protein VKB16_22715, partial [Beijerinckiaceae bacterium]|nr:hypothetical protein [Beijerinckiaceae bacterium]
TELLVRAAQDRSLGDGGRLFGRADALAEGGRARLRLPAKPGRPAREVADLYRRLMAPQRNV